jgi:hypothetical protein
MMARMRGKRLLVAIAVVVIVGAVAFRALRLSELARLGAGYAAEQTCACLFVGGRSLDSCRTDLDPLARKIVSLRPGSDEVTASSLGLASATAHYEKGFGCSLRN